jgi:hypothetical protein
MHFGCFNVDHTQWLSLSSLITIAFLLQPCADNPMRGITGVARAEQPAAARPASHPASHHGAPARRDSSERIAWSIVILDGHHKCIPEMIVYAYLQ